MFCSYCSSSDIFTFFASCIILGSFVGSVKQYDGYQLISVHKATNDKELEALVSLQKEMPYLDFWSEPSVTTKTLIMVSPENRMELERHLTTAGLTYDITIQDVESVIEKQVTRAFMTDPGKMTWSAYHRLQMIYTWLDHVRRDHPRKMTLSSLGKSYERKDIRLVKISAGRSKSKLKKPAIFIDSGMHAREWISVSTCTYIIQQLVNVTGADKELLTKLDWYFVPVLNPDGYEYSHTVDRLWRKTRTRMEGSDCIGVDINRNFGGVHWGESGATPDPCSNVYEGPYPFSVAEVNATAQFIYARRNQIKAYISLHSFSQKFLAPYGYTKQLPEDYADLKVLAEKAAAALKLMNGTEFKVGPSSYIYGQNSGNSRDWAKAYAKIKYSYTLELRDTGKFGFLVPASQIEPTGKETWEAIKVIAKHLINSK